MLATILAAVPTLKVMLLRDYEVCVSVSVVVDIFDQGRPRVVIFGDTVESVFRRDRCDVFSDLFLNEHRQAFGTVAVVAWISATIAYSRQVRAQFPV